MMRRSSTPKSTNNKVNGKGFSKIKAHKKAAEDQSSIMSRLSFESIENGIVTQTAELIFQLTSDKLAEDIFCIEMTCVYNRNAHIPAVYKNVMLHVPCQKRLTAFFCCIIKERTA